MDVQYIVDSAAELGEITPLECAAIYLIDRAYRRVDNLIASNMGLPEDFLANTARIAMRTAPEDIRHWVALNSLRSVHELSKCIQSRAEYLIQEKVQGDLGIVNPDFRQLIHGIAENRGAFNDRLVQSEEDVTETTARAILARHMGGFVDRLQQDAERIDKAIAWYQKDGGRKFAELQRQHRATQEARIALDMTELARVTAAEKARKRMENKRPVRGAIKKVCKLFAQFKQEDNLRMFVSGHEVELSHPDSQFKFILRPLGEPGWLEDRSAKGRAHTPYDLSLLTKDDVFVARLCVYFKDTPVLDQLLALTLFVHAGDELKVLEKANFFSFNADDGRETLVAAYPSLVSKFPKSRGVDEPDLRAFPDSARYNLQRQHWEPFKGRVEAWVGTWLEPMFGPLLPKADMFWRITR